MNLCVIAVCDDKRPTADIVKAMFETNSAGAGIAWRAGDSVEDVEDIVSGTTRQRLVNPRVIWRKGLDLKGVQELCASVPLPFVVHFRIPTAGGTTPLLTHPFPVTNEVALDLKGEIKGYVLFHNGHWSSWKQASLETALKMGIKIPSGKWSDSRAMAWAASLYGPGVLDMIDEKSVLFGPDNVEICGSGWKREMDLWVSNDHWVGKVPRTFVSVTDRRLPAAYRDRAQSHIRTEEPNGNVALTPAEQAKADTKGTGGRSVRGLPFLELQTLWKQGKVSKNQWKKAKKRHEREEELARKVAKQLAAEAREAVKLVSPTLH